MQQAYPLYHSSDSDDDIMKSREKERNVVWEGKNQCNTDSEQE